MMKEGPETVIATIRNMNIKIKTGPRPEPRGMPLLTRQSHLKKIIIQHTLLSIHADISLADCQLCHSDPISANSYSMQCY